MLNLQDASLLRTQCLIDGQWVGSEQTIAVTNPATGAHIATVPRFGAVQARQAIEAAQGPCRSANFMACEPGSALMT